MTKFLITNALFVLGMIILMTQQIKDWRVWTLYIVIWCIADYYFADGIHLKWWHWALIIAGLSVLDLAIIWWMG